MSTSSRGRVVMLVDNEVEFDSRVQKQARSAAAAGWEVHLLGRRRSSPRLTWKIGEADVSLLKLDERFLVKRHLLRRAPLRAPLAYNRPVMAKLRQQWVKAQKRDLRMRKDLLTLRRQESGPTLGGTISSVWVTVRSGWTRQMGRWVNLRARKTLALERRRKSMDGPLDRFTTAFWTRTMGVRAWRRLEPTLWDWEISYGSAVDRLKPDIIHANDFRMLGVGARAAVRARAAGRKTALVWDAHEFLPGLTTRVNPRWQLGHMLHEREFAPFADRVVTVSDELGELLVAEHGLSQKPVTVLNAPDMATVVDASRAPDVRSSCGLDADVPLLVYCGAAAPQRGLDVMVEALPRFPETHVALVVPVVTAAYVVGLVERAHELGAGDRIHVLPYVAVDEIVPFLSTATIGVHPLLHWLNHEISLGTKFFEYAHARLPILMSDVRAMGDKVRETGQGEVFVAGDVESYATALTALLADPARYRAAYDEPGLLDGWTWEAQAKILDSVYESVGPRADDRSRGPGSIA